MTKPTKKKFYTSNKIRTKYSEIFITVWKLFQDFTVILFSEFWSFYLQTEETGLNILVVHWNSNFLWFFTSTVEYDYRNNQWDLQFSSVQSLSRVQLVLRPHESQHTRPPCPSPTPGVHSDSCPSSQWCHPAISSSIVPFSSCPQSHPASESFPMSQLFAWGGQVLEFQIQHHSLQRNPRADLFQNGLVESPCSPRDSQESSPTPQFKSISSSVLRFLHSPPLTSIHDHWKNHSLD